MFSCCPPATLGVLPNLRAGDAGARPALGAKLVPLVFAHHGRSLDSARVNRRHHDAIPLNDHPGLLDCGPQVGSEAAHLADAEGAPSFLGVASGLCAGEAFRGAFLDPALVLGGVVSTTWCHVLPFARAFLSERHEGRSRTIGGRPSAITTSTAHVSQDTPAAHDL